MAKHMNKHIIARYRDGLRLIDFCKVCGAEELQLHEECKGKADDISTETKPEKFVSGLPDPT